MKKALIITYYWPPAGGPGVQRWLKFTKYLGEFGIDPMVLTVDPEKGTYPLRDDSLTGEVSSKIQVFRTNTFEPFGAYKKATGRGEVPFSGFANESDKPGPRQKIAKFIRGNFFLPDARKGWNKYALAKALELIQEHDIDTIITSSPPHSTQLIGLELKKKLGIKWLADMRDPWTDIYYYNDLYPTKIAKAIDRRMERDVLLNADVVTTVSSDMKRLLASKDSRIIEDKIVVLPNGFDDADFKDWQGSNNETFKIVYSGTLTHKYNIQVFLEALDELAGSGMKANLVFAGNQDEIVQNQLAELKHLPVERLGYVSHAKALENVKNSDALFLAIPDLPDNKGILTGKLFEYLAAKRPLINIGPVDGDAARIILKANSGKTCDYNDREGIKILIQDFYQDWKDQKKREFNVEFINSFSRKSLTKKLVEIIA